MYAQLKPNTSLLCNILCCSHLFSHKLHSSPKKIQFSRALAGSVSKVQQSSLLFLTYASQFRCKSAAQITIQNTQQR